MVGMNCQPQIIIHSQDPHNIIIISPQTTILITSRPDCSVDLHGFTNRVEILGFTVEYLHKYFESVLQSEEQFSHDEVNKYCDRFRDHLHNHPVIEGSCYIPLNAAILVHVFLSCEQTLPATQYDLFSNLVLCCINRERETRTQNN